ncbi:uncharacterized protein LOC133815252 [Humulus lupulus]|uniref:uncharacterized protein LOC133815252 n=1 Tax=Humulus lupulus TaxID=3486 RepID=UPI002B4119CF|nr:uncharacterized protein LOC133815252 [Humulus lupulus]
MEAHHVRSNSLHSKQHPLIPEYDKQLCRLRSSEAATSSSTVVCKLNGLQNLHDCVDNLICLPLNQQGLCREQNRKCLDEILDGSLRLLDVCDTAKDVLLQAKEATQELQSVMRRRYSGETELTCEIKNFLASRKVMKKALRKAMENRCNFSPLNKDQETVKIVSVLRDVESITLAIFQSLISFISGRNLQSKSNKWSFVSKMMNSKRVSCEEVIELNKFASVDAALSIFIGQKLKKSDNKLEEIVQNDLKALELCIQDLEGEVESLYRRLIKTRVSLLNTLNY